MGRGEREENLAREDLDFYDESDDEDIGVTMTSLDGDKIEEEGDYDNSDDSLKFPENEASSDILNPVSTKARKAKGGGFQSMGLSHEVLRAILKLGYNVPTPIQRKAIPLAFSGNDVVAMARTGSGKTAAFLIPIVQNLKAHSTKVGSRALVLAPTRELALQTFRFATQLCKLTDLRICLLVGGENLETQFGLLAQNPDIIIATPGRLMHHLAEVGMTLRSVEMLVFDEADRLFEMGFSAQIGEIMRSMSDKRQTLLFSATLPSALAEFARAGLHNPVLLRLDVEAKLSENLRMSFLSSRIHDKPALVVYLLKEVIPRYQQTVIFMATKHHVEYMNGLLKRAFIPCTMIYGSMDQSARKINIAKFRANKTRVLIVTDVAARGIDLPALDNVINCDFPAKSKLFVHRVGRVARAGRTGQAFSLVSSDELSYMVDLNLFLGSDVRMYQPTEGSAPDSNIPYYGSIPQDLLDSELGWVKAQISGSVELQGLERTMNNAYKLYYRTRPPPSPESVRRAKLLPDAPVHPLLLKHIDEDKRVHLDYLKALKGFRPTQTVFEAKMNTQGGPSVASEVMSKKRAFHATIIEKEAKSKTQKQADAEAAHFNKGAETDEMDVDQEVPTSNKKRKTVLPPKKKKENNFVDEEFFLSSFNDVNSYAEKGLAIREQNGITSDAIFDMAPDDVGEEYKRKQIIKWDRKDMKYKKHNIVNKVKIDTKFYKEWTKATHGRIQKEGEQEVAFKYNPNARKDLGLEDTLKSVNKEVRQNWKSKQVKPQQQIKANKLKKWTDKNKQDSQRQDRVHKRQQKVKKGKVGFKAQHKHKASFK